MAEPVTSFLTGRESIRLARGRQPALPPCQPSLPAAVVWTVVSALAYAASFPPLSLGCLGWVALVPWLVVCVRVTPGRAAWLGALWAAVVAYGVASWLPAMIATFFDRPLYVGFIGFVTVTTTLFAAYFIVFAAWLSWLARRRAVGPLLVGAAWVTCEFARAKLFLGNPWALSAYSQVDFAALMQVADIAGPYGVGFCIGAVNALVAGLLVAPLRGRRPAVGRVATAGLLAAVLLYGRWQLAEPFGSGPDLRVSLVQGAITRGFGWQPEYASLGLGRYLALTRAANASAPDLIIWPEHAVSFYPDESSAESDALLTGTRRISSDVVLGAPHYVPGNASPSFNNSIFLVRGGQIADRYDKQKLLPVAEHAVLGVTGDQMTSFTSGPGSRPLATRAALLGAFVCFEAMYPEVVREFAAAGAEVLANLSNDVWFGSHAASQQHLDMARVRAIENRRFLVRAAGTGISAVVDPYGRVTAQSDIGAVEVLTQPIRISRTHTLYQWWGDAVAWLAVGSVLAASLAAMVVKQARA